MKRMVIDGKTKRVFERPDGHLEFHFKDDATGCIDQATGRAVFDSGYDSVVGQIPGKGRVSCQFSKYFFELLKKTVFPPIMSKRSLKMSWSWSRHRFWAKKQKQT